MSEIDPRTPVLVGVDAVNAGWGTAVDLMTETLTRAARGAGTDRLLRAIDRIVVPQGTWTDSDAAGMVARRIGRSRATTWLGKLGVSQQWLLTESIRAIRDGACDVVAVIGGDSRLHMVNLQQEGQYVEANAGTTGVPIYANLKPDLTIEREPDFLDPVEIAAGLVQPVAQYAMIENALGHAEGTPPEVQRRQIAELWGRFNRVATRNKSAAFGEPRSADEIATPGNSNRVLAFPYNKWHASQWTVNQAAALLLCSAEKAAAFGIPRDRWVFPLVSLDASCAVPLVRRRELHHWPSMRVIGDAAARRIGRPLSEVELIEVYSCFPSAVRVQQRELGLPLDGTPTVTGGMTFAGGPFNNYMYQSTVEIVRRLREQPGALAAVTSVCGLLTKPGLTVWSTSPDGQPPLLDDLAEVAMRETPVAESLGDYRGPAKIVTFTVVPDSAEVPRSILAARRLPPWMHDPYKEGAGIFPPKPPDLPPYPVDPYAVGTPRTMIIAETPDGRRTVCASTDLAVAADAVRNGLIGHAVSIDGSSFSA